MAKQTINVGTSANDGTGDKIRVAFQKCNSNFTELYDAIPSSKQYKFLLSQSGGDDPQTATSGSLTQGVTYEIVAFETGDDFTPSGAPNNTVGTKWIANGTAPTWSEGSEIGFDNAPIVNNNFGLNDFWLERGEFSGTFTGCYYIKSDGKFTENKVFFPTHHGFCEWLPDTANKYGLNWIDENTILIVTADNDASYVDGLLNNTPISFEIFN